MGEGKSSKLDTEGSARVLNEVKGRLERMETGEMPVIQRVTSDGSVRQVDATGEMVRPDAERIAAMNEAAEAFAAEHGAGANVETPSPTPDGADESRSGPDTKRPRGLWARIKAWFTGT